MLNTDLRWVDRTGKQVQAFDLRRRPGSTSTYLATAASLSKQQNQSAADIWLIDGSGAPPRRLTFDPAGDPNAR